MGEYHRKGFGLKETVKPLLEAQYASRMVDLLRSKGHQITRNGLTVRLAKEFGFCYGVERAVDIAYQTQLKTTFESIKNYQLKFYYNGQWKPEYDRWACRHVCWPWEGAHSLESGPYLGHDLYPARDVRIRAHPRENVIADRRCRPYCAWFQPSFQGGRCATGELS